MRPTRHCRGRLITLITFAACLIYGDESFAERDQEWWPERVLFQSTGGRFREQPTLAGAYVYDAGDAVLVDTLGSDGPVAGTTKLRNYAEGLQFLPLPRGHIAAWNLATLTPGRYWIGVQVNAGDEGKPDQADSNWGWWVRVNGRCVDCSTLTAPVYVGNGSYAAEIQAALPVELKPGDRIAIQNTEFVGRLTLYPEEPRRGPISRVPGYLTTGTMELWTSGLWAGMADSNGQAVVSYWLRNTANGPQELNAEVRVIDYFGRSVATHSKQYQLADWQRIEDRFEFPVGDAPRYRVRMTVRGNKGVTKETSTFLRADVTNGTQQSLSLDGRWEQCRIPKAIELGDAPPPDATWEPYGVPGPLRMGAARDADPEHRHTHVAWVRRAFEVPDRMKGQRLVLSFERLADEAVLYVNAKEVGRHYGSRDPYSVDITSAVRYNGPNELLIGIRDWISYVNPPALEANGPEWNTDPAGVLIAPISLWGPSAPVAGVTGHVAVLSRPDLAVTDVYARPSFRKKELRIDLTLTNSGSTNRRVLVAPVVRDAGRAVLTLPEKAVTVKAGTDLAVTIASPFRKPRLWSLDDPHLYELAIRLKDDTGVLDEHCSRFGFREFYIRNGRFMLNDRVAKLSSLPKEEGGSFLRHYSPGQDILDGDDEDGYLHAMGAPWCVGPREFSLNSGLYWKNAADFARNIVRGLRGHPSIVMWEVSNEWACFSDSIGTTDPAGGREIAARRLLALADAIRSVDPDRPTFSSADGDLGGRGEIISLHYPRDRAPLERTSESYIPDAYLWRPIGQPLKRGQSCTLGSNGMPVPTHYLEKPVMMNEIGQFGIAVAHDTTLIGGEEPYRSQSSATSYWQSALDRYIVDGARDIEASHCQPWSHPFGQGTSRLTMPLRYAVALDYMGHWRAGERVDFQTNLHHDLLWPEKMAVRWALLDAAGHAVKGGVLADRIFYASELQRTRLRFSAPKVERETHYRFRLEVLCDGQADFVREEPFVVYPSSPEKVRLNRRFAVYDPAGRALKALSLLGVQPKALAVLDTEALSGTDVLLIGPDAVTAETAPRISKPVQGFVERGGRVIVFEHERPVRWLPYLLTADTVRQSSFLFPRVPDHPALKGIAAEDLRLWRNDRIVSRHDYLKPSRGSVLPLVDGGGKLGLEWTPLLEAYHGKGSYVLCQMLVTRKAAQDPCAARMLANLLRYTDGPLYCPPQPVTVVAKPDSPLAKLMERLAVDVPVTPPESSGSLQPATGILVDASTDLGDLRVAEVLDVARAGGRVILHGLTDKTATTWGRALGARLELRSVSPSYLGRAIRRDWDPLLTGLSMHELHWHKPEGGDGDSFRERARLGELARTEVATDAAGARICTCPAVLLSLPCGQGEVLVDQTEWDRAGESVGPLARRIASTLLTNLGARFEAVRATRQVSGPLAYVPIDLSGFVNRPLADDVADDGEGGWSDQGPRLDAREFPTGRVVVQGVPFCIGGDKEVDPHRNIAIVLNGDRFKQQVPAVEGIPVGWKVETLCFLHTGAWINESDHVLSYVVHYADGAQEEIAVIGGINIYDWWMELLVRSGTSEFLDELPGVSTRIGLVAENPTFQAVGAYLMEWVNPYPDKTITSLDCVYTTTGLATPAILGITAGVQAADAVGAVESPKGDRRKAEALTQQGGEWLAAGRYSDAETALRQALAADPEYGRAAFLLGRLYRGLKRYPEAIRSYRRAAGLLPTSTEVLNELAELFESQGKKIQALIAYQQSLKLNWNQPPVLDAVNRLR